jgi:hypothetical protein
VEPLAGFEANILFVRQTRLAQALTGFWLLWFTATVIQQPATRVCPIHAAGAHHAAHVHAMHSSHADGTQSHTDHGKAACDCPDECRCGAPAAPVLPVAINLREPVTIACDSPAASTPLAVALQRAHALPFANAPPVSATVCI